MVRFLCASEDWRIDCLVTLKPVVRLTFILFSVVYEFSIVFFYILAEYAEWPNIYFCGKSLAMVSIRAVPIF